jgi:hypothetical protein
MAVPCWLRAWLWLWPARPGPFWWKVHMAATMNEIRTATVAAKRRRVALPARQNAGVHGNTSPGRLDRLDVFLREFLPALFDGTTATPIPAQIAFDVGFGATPHTLFDLRARLSRHVRLVGTETDAERLHNAKEALFQLQQQHQQQHSTLEIRKGDAAGWFQLPLDDGEPKPSLVRCMNVLRDYHPARAARGLQVLASQLRTSGSNSRGGGVLLEGSASTSGTVSAACIIRRGRTSGDNHGSGGDNGGGGGGAGDGDSSSSPPESQLESVVFCVDLVTPVPKLRGVPSCWFSRVVPQAFLHQRSKGKSCRQGSAAAEAAAAEVVSVNSSAPPTPPATQHMAAAFKNGCRGRKWQQGTECPVGSVMALWREADSEAFGQLSAAELGRMTAAERWRTSVQCLSARVPRLADGTAALRMHKSWLEEGWLVLDVRRPLDECLDTILQLESKTKQ